MTPAELATRLQDVLAAVTRPDGAPPSVEVVLDECVVTTCPDAAHAVLEAIKAAGFDSLIFVTVVDRHEHFTVTYRVGDMGKGVQVFVETDVPRDAPSIATVFDLWPSADWHEREVYDLFGITFEGHPDLRRLVLPEDWVGHPLRKDYEDPSMERRPNYI